MDARVVGAGAPVGTIARIATAALTLGLASAANAALSSMPMDGPPTVTTIVRDVDPWYLDFDGGHLYWAEFSPASRIRKVDPADGVVVDILTLSDPLERPISVDAVGERIYFTKDPLPQVGRGSSIVRAWTDGSHPVDLVTGLGGGVVQATGVAVGRDHVYWGMKSSGLIQRSDLVGGHAETFLSGLGDPNGIELDLANRFIYWTDTKTMQLNRSPLDGGPIQTVVAWGGRKQDLALDVAGNKLYWTDEDLDAVYRADLDGANVALLLRTERPSGIALDLQARKVYFMDGNTPPVPWPGAFWLMGAGLLGLAGRVRQMRRQGQGPGSR